MAYISVMGDWAFSYDAMDRLSTAMQLAATHTSTQFASVNGSWSYDSYGNRTAQTFSNSVYSNWATYNSTNNRIATAKSAVAGYVYDASGNTLYDGNNEYWYDAEGQLCAVQNQAVVGLPITQYIYDAEGARIGKGTLSAAPPNSTSLCAPPFSSGFTLTTRYLVDQGGGQVTELNTQNGTASVPLGWAHSNVFSAARLTATYDASGLHYALADPLGTKRIQANTTGIVEEWYVSLPYGDVLTPIPNPACTAANNCYPEDATEHHFTGKERDTESGNDYFGARYYASSMGRFMSPDWADSPEAVPYAKLDDPQTLNLYTYMRNNPLKGTDPDGHSPEWWQKFWNGLAGYGRVTDAQRDARIAEQRQWLIDHSPDDATKDHYKNATGQVVFESYGCMQSSSCLQDAVNAGQVVVQVVGAVVSFKIPVPGLSGKEGAKDAPSWAKQYKPKVGESGRDFAKRLLNEKYGEGNWKTGPGTEANQIQKWADRSFMDPK